MWYILVFVVLCSVAAGENVADNVINEEEIVKRSQISSCTPKYAALPSSTMCMFRDDPRAKSLGVNKVNQIVILAEHNKYRRLVRPKAKSMQKMYWDDEIAAIAQKWAQTCPRGHDTNENRQVPGYGIFIGQNWASGFSNWAKAVKAWYDEVSLYRYGQDPQTYLRNGFAEIGHYTQVVRDVAGRVGCGYAECPSRGKLYVCNYAFGNPLDWGRPYESGPTCQDCKKSCKNKLCDCHGTICLNGGILDPNTCTCQCPDLWAGATCEKLSCPASDPEVCGAEWGYKPPKCTEWINVPKECPYMCGICKDGDRPGPNSVLPPGGNSNRQNGRKPSSKGRNGNGRNPPKGNLELCTDVDPDYCGVPQPTGFEPKHCRIWMNVPEECPAMCGRCRPRCGEKTSSDCKNGGKLNAQCRCDCEEPFSGENCETLAKCPPMDAWYCGKNDGFSRDQCDTMSVVRKQCPIMCGLCEDKCPGMGPETCQNGGTLGEGCQCICTQEYTGQRCEKFVTCPRAEDEFWCTQFQPSNCAEYFNFPTDCPHMCDAC